MEAKLSFAVVYELWQYPPEPFLLIDGEEGNTDPDKAMHKHDPSTHTTGVKPPLSSVGCQGSSLMKHFSCTEITLNNSGQCL